MIMPISPSHLHTDAEQLLQSLHLQNVFFRPVSDDSSAAHQHDALNLWNNVP